MTVARKIESMGLSSDCRTLYAGTIGGEILTIDVAAFAIRGRRRAHDGAIQAVAVHPVLPYVAALGSDRAVTIWRRDAGGLRRIAYVSLRQFRATNDPGEIAPVHSTSQALAFHDTAPRLATRTASAALVELDFDDDGNVVARGCVRLHGDSDMTSVRYVADEDAVLSGSIDGDLVLSLAGAPLRRWQLDHRSNIHWAERIGGRDYVLATDRRNLVRVDLDRPEPVVVGPVFTRDDLEHVTINRDTGHAYCASFDRTIYRVDPARCVPLGVAFRPPFKCRWVRAFGVDPEVLLVQCRNGALYKADARTGSLLSEIKETPRAIWTAAARGGAIWSGGDGEALTRLTVGPAANGDDRPTFDVAGFAIPDGDDTYVKRLVVADGDALLLGRTDGVVLKLDVGGGAPVEIARGTLGSAVRDLAFDAASGDCYAACEDSTVRRLDGRTLAEVAKWHGDPLEPIWSVACAGEAGLVAAAERGGRVALLRAGDLGEISYAIPTGRPKRMKFDGAGALLFVNRDRLDVLDLADGRVSTRIAPRGNTIEDFIWDRQRRYLLTVGYTQTIGLFDFATGEQLCEVPDQVDYSKGLIWARPGDGGGGGGDGPLDFITFGRSGRFHLFRVHDEKILSLGDVRPRSVGPAPERSTLVA